MFEHVSHTWTSFRSVMGLDGLHPSSNLTTHLWLQHSLSMLSFIQWETIAKNTQAPYHICHSYLVNCYYIVLCRFHSLNLTQFGWSFCCVLLPLTGMSVWLFGWSKRAKYVTFCRSYHQNISMGQRDYHFQLKRLLPNTRYSISH